MKTDYSATRSPTPLEGRIFNAVILLVSFLGLAATILNILFVDFNQVCITTSSTVVSGIVYLYSIKTGKWKPLVFPGCIFFSFVIVAAWLIDIGLYSSVSYYFYILIVVSTIVLDNRHKTPFAIIIISIVGVLIARDFIHPPHIPMDEKSRVFRLADIGATILLSLGILIIILRIVIREHIRARENILKAMEEIKTLRGFLPICAKCKKVRDSSGYWNMIEEYIEKHSEAEFSHGLCPDCLKAAYRDMAATPETAPAATDAGPPVNRTAGDARKTDYTPRDRRLCDHGRRGGEKIVHLPPQFRKIAGTLCPAVLIRARKKNCTRSTPRTV